MVKHNNIIPNIHCSKKYCESSRGPLKVRVPLNQAARKKARRIARAAKAAKIAPAPLRKLKPVVHCPTQKYNSKVRLGKGFTLDELKAVKLHPAKAMKMGITVDYRRRTKSEETLAANVARLEEYLSRIIILKKKSDTIPADAGALRPANNGQVIQPIVKATPTIEMQEVTADMKAFKAYTTMRVVRQETRIDGYRIAVVQRKKKE